MARLLVTGGAGFIGSHFIRAWLASHPSDEVVNLDLLTYAGSVGRLTDVRKVPRYRFLQGDICDPKAVLPAMQGVDVVVHFAAETHVDRSITNATPFLRTNIEGTYALLTAAQAGGVKRFIHLSTDEVYGPILQGAVDERAPLSPHSPYAASKAAGDLLVQAFHKTFKLPTIVARPTNIFGPGQFPEKFIPLTITNTLDGLPIPIYGDGRQRRGWLFVEDVCAALRVMVERGEVGRIYNIGSGHEMGNLETAKAIVSQMGASQDLVTFVADRPAHDRRYAMADEPIRGLGWQPQVPFEEGLRKTISWYRGQTEWWHPLARKLREDPYHWLNRSSGSSTQQAIGADR